MERKPVSGMTLAFLIVNLLVSAFLIQPTKAIGTIYIRADGSVDPITAPIQRDEDSYTFTADIYDSIEVQRSNIVIDGARHTLQGSGSANGFRLIDINNVTIQNTNIRGFLAGVSLSRSSNNVIARNNITANRDGILLTGSWSVGSSYNNVCRNDIRENSRYGISIFLSSNNNIARNNITNNLQGIRLFWSSYNVLRANLMVNNTYNFELEFYHLSDFVNDVDSSNTADGKPIYYWMNKRDLTVPTDAGCVALINCTNITVENLKLTRNGHGILLFNTNNSRITQNDITANKRYGIFLFWYSSNNSIARNNITNNNLYGINFWLSSNNSISENRIAGNRGQGILLVTSSNNNIINRNSVTSSGHGIQLQAYSNNNMIVENHIARNYYHGIFLEYCSTNIIARNNILCNTYYGVGFAYSSNNRFYHNNFVNNTEQVYILTSRYANFWDDGYPSGGNYWSDYQEKYPNAQELDDSGIWDTPYVIDESNQDNYPLVEPWAPPTITASVDIDTNTLSVRSKGKWITAYIQLPEGYNSSAIDATTILLNGTIASVLDPKYDFVTNSSEYLVDHNSDGILERMVKFNRTAVEDFILSKGYKYGNVTLTVTGLLYDGASFEGSDTVLVKVPGDANCDGVVDDYDLMMVGKTFGAKAGQLLYDPNADFNLDGIIDDYELIILGKNFGKTYQ